MIETKVVAPQDVPPLRMRINPLWWLMCGGTQSTWRAPEINNGAAYLPNVKNQLLRNVMWWLRNPCANFVGFIIGFEGMVYTVRGPAPVLATTWRDYYPGGGLPQRMGWKWSLINGWAPFVSYWGGHLEAYLGWRPASGGLGAKLVWTRKST